MTDLLVLLAPPGRRVPTREVVSVRARASRFYCGQNSALVWTPRYNGSMRWAESTGSKEAFTSSISSPFHPNGFSHRLRPTIFLRSSLLCMQDLTVSSLSAGINCYMLQIKCLFEITKMALNCTCIYAYYIGKSNELFFLCRNVFVVRPRPP